VKFLSLWCALHIIIIIIIIIIITMVTTTAILVVMMAGTTGMLMAIMLVVMIDTVDGYNTLCIILTPVILSLYVRKYL
jgi:hypothetical protein